MKALTVSYPTAVRMYVRYPGGDRVEHLHVDGRWYEKKRQNWKLSTNQRELDCLYREEEVC